MASEELAILVQAHLDGRLDAESRARLTVMLRDPAQRSAAVEQVQVATILAGLAPHEGDEVWRRVEAGLAAVRPTQRPRSVEDVSRRVRGRRWPLAAGLAAALLAASTGWLLAPAAPPPAPAQPGLAITRDGHPLADGVRIGAADPIVLAVGGGTVTVGGGSSALVVRAERQVRLALDRGSIACALPPLPAGTGLTIATAHGAATVVGTRFLVTRHLVGTHLAVGDGTVRCTPLAGAAGAVPAGHDAWLDESGWLSVAPLARAEPLHAGLTAPSSRAPLKDLRLRAELGPLGQPAVAITLPSRGWVAWYHDDTAVDWRGFTGLRLWLRGAGSGATFHLEVADNAAPGPGDRMERFSVPVVDDRTGWRLLDLPFARFTRRSDQHPTAPDDGFGRDQVHGWSLYAEERPVEVVIAGVALY